jgi:drug/metabolite transporter (DMT)-like permease
MRHGHHATGRSLPFLALVGATSIWGSSSVATKIAVAEVPPISLAFGRVAVAYLVLIPLVRLRGSQPAKGRVPALLGVIGVAAFVLLRNVGLRSAPAGDASLFEGGASPALALALAVVLLGERPSGQRLAGLLGAMAGVALAILPERVETGGGALLGDGLLLAAAVCFAGNTVLGRLGYAGGDALAVVAGATRYGLLALVPFVAGEWLTSGVPVPDGRTLLLVAHLGAGCSAAAYGLWGYGLSRLEAGQVAIAGNLMFVFGLVAAALVLGEVPTPSRLLGAALILAGVCLAAVERPRQTAASPAVSAGASAAGAAAPATRRRRCRVARAWGGRCAALRMPACARRAAQSSPRVG